MTTIREQTKEEMKRVNQKKKKKLSSSLITKIPETNVYYNSVNIAVARQRSGKTFTIIEEIINISKVCPNTHLLIYSNKTGYPTDDTFEEHKVNIRIPIVYVAHDKLPDFLKELFAWKQFYKEVREDEIQDLIIDEQLNGIFQNLYINSFDHPFLHTLILLDDVAQAKILKNEKTYIQEMMTQCAHIHCSFFLSVQFWKALTPNIKENVTTIFLFGGFSKRTLGYIFSQTNTSVNIDEFHPIYQSLADHQRVIIDSKTDNINFDK